MPSPHSPKQDHLLDALPAEDYARLLTDLELIAMPLGWAVYESGGHLGYLYFPTTSIVSLLRHGKRRLGGNRHHRQRGSNCAGGCC